MLLLIQLNSDCNGFSSWLWPLIIAFILGAILGWLLSKILGNSNDDSSDYKQRYLDTKADLDSCRKNADSNLAGASILGASGLAAKTVTDNTVKDDLTKVEGIGPKIKGLLNDDGIWSWQQLSETTVDKIQEILDNAGPRYRIHKPDSWPKQAGMCARGEWDKLKIWQDEHKGGRL
ncbi:MAG TPA: hypothetical protein EYG80_05640 [Flavobacteriaceae bacterium]|nr:hypothetical protein [Flavobacteriaceae bacterium]HIP27120.1 hypothetical protein [Flavobacteriaceae bacterium]